MKRSWLTLVKDKLSKRPRRTMVGDTVMWVVIAGFNLYQWFTSPKYDFDLSYRIFEVVICLLLGSWARVLIAYWIGEYRTRRQVKVINDSADAVLSTLATELPKRKMPCPACGERIAIADIEEHIRDHHSDPEHETHAITVLMRPPGSNDWLPMRKERR